MVDFSSLESADFWGADFFLVNHVNASGVYDSIHAKFFW